MSDIFLNFNFTDHKAATKLAAVFQRQGWTVWKALSGYDPNVFTHVEAREMRSARLSIALWSRKASESSTFRAALEIEGRPAGVHVLLEKVELAAWLGMVSFDLSDWNGAESHPELKRLLRLLHTQIGAAQSPSAPPVSFEDLSLSEMQENARRAVQEATGARPEDEKRFGGVFISYRRNEAAAYAGRLYDRLAARFGREKVFIDTELENVDLGEDFVEAITSAAESCAVMVVLISRQWLRSEVKRAGRPDYVRLEVSKALERKIRVIPILIQGATMPEPEELPEDLSLLIQRNYFELRDTRWERDVEDLMKSLERLLKDSGNSSGEVWRVI